MIKSILSIVTILLATGLHGSDFRGWEHFKAPDIAGGYCADWNTLGLSDKGFDFGVGFYLNGNDESIPVNFWISKKTNILIEISSIAAVNNVVTDAFVSQGASEAHGNPWLAIDAVRRLLSTQIASNGRTGLSLYFEHHRDLISVISRLKSAGLDEATTGLLLRLGGECSQTENSATKEWSAIWYEIDKLGGIERVTIRGSLEPVKVVSVLHEAIFDAGKVSPKLLDRSNFFDLSLNSGNQ